MHSKQKLLLFKAVARFIEDNLPEILDYGLADDIVVGMYEDNYKILESNASPAAKRQAMDTLSTILYSMSGCAQGNLSEGRNLPVFQDFLAIVHSLLNEYQS